MLLWVRRVLEQATQRCAMLTLTCCYLQSACDAEHALLRSSCIYASCFVGAGRAVFCHHTAHCSPRAVCSHGLGLCNRGVALRPSGLWEDTCGQGHCQRVRSQLHLHQGARCCASSASDMICCFSQEWSIGGTYSSSCLSVPSSLRSHCLALSTEHVRPACQILQGCGYRFRVWLLCTGFPACVCASYLGPNS